MPKVYLLFIFILLLLTVINRLVKGRKIHRFSRLVTWVFMLIIALEFICLLAIFIDSGRWLFMEQHNINSEVYVSHPYLVGVPKQGVSVTQHGVTYSHNSLGFRGKEIVDKKEKTRIIAIGGSTTYGIGVSDHQTWPYYLDSLLGGEFEVLNFGMTGHSTVEHIIQCSFMVAEYQPDILLFHVGLNDIRSMYIHELMPDYSNFHAPTLMGSLGLCYQNDLPAVAVLKVLVITMQKLGYYPVCPYHQAKPEKYVSDGIDTQAVRYFSRNLNTLLTINKLTGAKQVFIPQIISKEAIEAGKMKWWIPNLDDDELVNYMKYYNGVTEKVVEFNEMVYVDAIDNYLWKKKHFVDASHLNVEGNKVFAGIVANEILNITND